VFDYQIQTHSNPFTNLDETKILVFYGYAIWMNPYLLGPAMRRIMRIEVQDGQAPPLKMQYEFT